MLRECAIAALVFLPELYSGPKLVEVAGPLLVTAAVLAPCGGCGSLLFGGGYKKVGGNEKTCERPRKTPPGPSSNRAEIGTVCSMHQLMTL